MTLAFNDSKIDFLLIFQPDLKGVFMFTAEIAKGLVDLCKHGKNLEAVENTIRMTS